jgi:hypothetical protein
VLQQHTAADAAIGCLLLHRACSLFIIKALSTWLKAAQTHLLMC